MLTRYPSKIILPGLVVVIVLVLWQLGTVYLKIPFYVLASPAQTLRALWDARIAIARNLFVTLLEAGSGFTLGIAIAFICAAVFVRSTDLRNGCFPLAVVAQTIPIVVYVPFLTIILGFGISSKIAIAVLISFFPALVNIVRGFVSVDKIILDYMYSINASWWQIFWKLRVPSSFPFLFASLKVTSTLSIVGAMVGEWASGSFAGIGYLILIYNNQLRTDLLQAAVIVASLSSIIFYTLISQVEKVIVKW